MVPEAPRQLSPGVPLGFWGEVVVLLSVDKSRDFDRATVHQSMLPFFRTPQSRAHDTHNGVYRAQPHQGIPLSDTEAALACTQRTH